MEMRLLVAKVREGVKRVRIRIKTKIRTKSKRCSVCLSEEILVLFGW